MLKCFQNKATELFVWYLSGWTNNCSFWYDFCKSFTSTSNARFLVMKSQTTGINSNDITYIPNNSKKSGPSFAGGWINLHSTQKKDRLFFLKELQLQHVSTCATSASSPSVAKDLRDWRRIAWYEFLFPSWRGSRKMVARLIEKNTEVVLHVVHIINFGYRQRNLGLFSKQRCWRVNSFCWWDFGRYFE